MIMHPISYPKYSVNVFVFQEISYNSREKFKNVLNIDTLYVSRKWAMLE